MASFKEAFAAARKAKKATFEWPIGSGDKFTTQLDGEDAGKTQRPKARPKAAGAERPKARPGNKGPAVMSDAPAQGKAPKADAKVTTVSATVKKPTARAATVKAVTDTEKAPARGGYSDRNPTYVPKPKVAAKTPSRADVAPKPTGKKAEAPKTAAFFKTLKGIFTGGGISDRERKAKAKK
jgi:hypothetical protein